MKKTLSLILAMLLIFSIGAMAVSADNGLVKVKFVVDGQVVYTIETLPDVTFVDRLQQGENKLETPTKPSTATTKYTFLHWECEETGEIAFTGTIPATDADRTYVAVFLEEEIEETQSFFKFIESVFERINRLFEYFAKVFEGIFEF